MNGYIFLNVFVFYAERKDLVYSKTFPLVRKKILITSFNIYLCYIYELKTFPNILQIAFKI